MASVQKPLMHGRVSPSPNAAKRGDSLVSARRLASNKGHISKVPSLPQLVNISVTSNRNSVKTPTTFHRPVAINPTTPTNSSKNTPPSSTSSSNGISNVKHPPVNVPPKDKVRPLRINIKLPLNHNTPPKAESLTERLHMKLDGIWDQYSECWFDIQCKALLPLFVEIPSPKSSKSLSIPEAKSSQGPAAAQPKSFRIYKCNYKKFLERDNEVIETCQGCLNKKRKGVRLGCNHFVCRECLQAHIKKHVEMERVPIRCMKQGCKYELDKAEVNKYAASTEIVKKYANLSVTKFVEKNPHMLVQCFTPGCGYVVDLSKLKQKDVLNCARCKTNYCMTCHKQAHPGTPCDDS